MPAANTSIKRSTSEAQPELVGVKMHHFISTRGAAENIANNPPMIRLTVAAGTRKRRSVIRLP